MFPGLRRLPPKKMTFARRSHSQPTHNPMKHSLTRVALGALLSAGLAHAAPFTGKGVPADAGAFVHIDLDAAGNSILTKTIRELGETSAMAPDEKAAFDKLKAELGIDPNKDIKDVTVSLATPAAGAATSPDAMMQEAFTMQVRGKFDQAKLLAIPKNHPEVKANKLGKHTWFSVSDLDKAFGDKGKAKTGNGKKPEGCVCPVDSSTILVAADVKGLTRALDAFNGKGAYKADAKAAKALAGNPFVAAYFSEAFVAAAQAGKPKAPAAEGEEAAPELKSLVFSLGETAGKLKLAVDAKMNSAAAATQVQAQLAMFQGFAQMGMSQSKPEDSAQEKADKAFGLSVVQALKIAAVEDSITADFAYPAEKLAAKLREKKDDIAKAVQQQKRAAVGAPAPAAEADE